jgi:hypothetical protein
MSGTTAALGDQFCTQKQEGLTNDDDDDDDDDDDEMLIDTPDSPIIYDPYVYM